MTGGSVGADEATAPAVRRLGRLAVWGSECLSCGNTTPASQRCDECHSTEHTTPLYIEVGGDGKVTDGTD